MGMTAERTKVVEWIRGDHFVVRVEVDAIVPISIHRNRAWSHRPSDFWTTCRNWPIEGSLANWRSWGKCMYGGRREAYQTSIIVAHAPRCARLFTKSASSSRKSFETPWLL